MTEVRAPKCCRRHWRESIRSIEDGEERKDAWLTSGMPYACTLCGNKRCPHATDCGLACTQSNEPGQAGSDYE